VVGPASKGMCMSVNAPGRAKIDAKTLRTDAWWLQPAITAAVLLSFIVYATWRAFEDKFYFVNELNPGGKVDLISPFYSPCLASHCVSGSSMLGQPIGSWWTLSPALLILVFPLGFRFTCYYYRKAYFRSFWLSPPACAVAEPHTKYTGETRFPLLVNNLHRYFFYIGLVFNALLTIDAFIAFRGVQGGFHMSVGTVVLLLNATFLWLYSLSCHSCRHAMGGRLNHFSKHPVRYRMWTWISRLNTHHPKFAWISLIGVALADYYVRCISAGTFTDILFF
jgi:hypothetical protein